MALADLRRGSAVKKSDPPGGSWDDLRRRAETQLKREQRSTGLEALGTDALRQLHELQVHQIELEMQNEELQRVRNELEGSLDRYTALYQFAPSGYLSLDRLGCIRELNLSAATLLGTSRADIVNRHFREFIATDSRNAFDNFLRKVFEQEAGTQDFDTSLQEFRPHGLPSQTRFLHLQCSAEESGDGCRLVIIDVTAREQANRALRDAEQHAHTLVAQNRALTQRMFALEESERREIARELHDEMGQWLTAISIEAEAILQVPADTSCQRIRDSASAIRDDTGHVQKVIRRMLYRLRPNLLDTLDLGDNLRNLVAEWRRHQPGLECALTIDGAAEALTGSPAVAAYRIVQESLSNIARHARARHVSITLQCGAPASAPEALQLTIEDDGIGMNTSAPQVGLGLLGMRERAIAVGGDLSITSKWTQGVRIIASLPLN